MKGLSAAGQKPALVMIRAIVIGAVAGALLCALLLACFAFAFVSAESIPHDFLPAFIVAVTVASAFLAGFVTARISKQKGLLCGSAAGLLLFLLFLLAGVALSQGHTGVDAVMRVILMVLSGGIGGLISVNGKGHRK